MDEGVLYEVDGGVATITLNCPAVRNALDTALLQGLREAFERAGTAEDIRAVVLTGAGKGFSSGADLSGFSQVHSADEVGAYIMENYLPLINAITTLPKPVIGALNGVAAGAGVSLALACDLRVMADDGALMMAFSNIGLVPDGGATWFLARLVGYSRAFEIASEGERIPAERCLELGLVNRVLPAAELQAGAREWATRLARRPTLALALTKQALTRALVSTLVEAIRYEAELQRQTIVSHDHREGIAAFVERRPPHFTGR